MKVFCLPFFGVTFVREWSQRFEKKKIEWIERGSDKWMKVPLARVLIENNTRQKWTTKTHIWIQWFMLFCWFRLLAAQFACMLHSHMYACMDCIRSEHIPNENRQTWQLTMSTRSITHRWLLTDEENIRGGNNSIFRKAEQRCWLLERKQTQTVLLFWWMIFASNRNS